MNYIDFKNSVMQYAAKSGLAEYELYYTESEDMSVETLKHEINSFNTNTNAGACFRCVYQDKMGFASTELFTEEEALRIVEAAIATAAVIENDDKVYIHEAGDTYQSMEPVPTTEPASAQMIEAVLALESKIFAKDARVTDGSQVMAGFCREKVALCNSKGLDLAYEYDYSQVGGMALIKEGEEMYDGFCIKTNDFTKFDLDQIAEDVVEEAVSLIGYESVDSGVYDIVLSNKMMAVFLSTFSNVFSAEYAQKGLSLFAGKEGQEVASKLVTITDDPFHKDSFVHMPFDSEGVATYCKNVVENGKLCTLLYNLSSAAKAGVASTGNGRKANYAASISAMPYNLYLEKGGAGTREDVFKAVGDGIYVTALNGIHAGANPVTGDFSLASEGFLIEGGEKKHVVKNFTISGNYYELLKKITLVGDDLEFANPKFGCCYGAPTVMVKGISVAGK